MVASDIGFFALVLALVLATYVVVAGPAGHRLNAPEMVASARNAVYAVSLLMLTALAVLAYSFVAHDFGVAFVASNSSLAQPWYYTFAGLYGGQAGSLLLWASGLGVFSGLAVWVNRGRIPAVMPYAMATMMVVLVFFLVVLIFLSNPFERLPVPLADGRGLNALLRDPGMLMHPPFLLIGYMSWTIPFAFAMGALISGRLDSLWLKAARPWILAAWAIQGTGLILGAWWAYHVLGWGGFWGWDPVENVALLPWLVGTAALHSIMVQERRGMLKKWNILLLVATFSLAIFGTFVVRGGLLDSVHNFALSALGPSFLSFLGVVMVVALFFFIRRLPLLRSDNGFDSAISKETGFLLNNLLLVGIAFATFWGTIFPLITELFQGSKITVGPPFFEKVNGPIFLALLVLMGIGPLLAWRRASWASIKRNFRGPLAAAVAWAVVMVLLLDVRNMWTLAGVSACALVFGTIVLEYYRGVRNRRQLAGEGYPTALGNLVARNRRRYGGYIVHLGILLIALGRHRRQPPPAGHRRHPRSRRVGRDRRLHPHLPRDRDATPGRYHRDAGAAGRAEGRQAVGRRASQEGRRRQLREPAHVAGGHSEHAERGPLRAARGLGRPGRHVPDLREPSGDLALDRRHRLPVGNDDRGLAGAPAGSSPGARAGPRLGAQRGLA